MARFKVTNLSPSPLSLASAGQIPVNGFGYASSLTADEYRLFNSGSIGLDATPFYDESLGAYTPALPSSYGNHIYGADDPVALRTFKLGAADVKSKQARHRVVFFGESTVVGTGNGSGTGGLDGSQALCFPTRFAQAMNSKGIYASLASFFATGSVTDAQIFTRDPRLNNQSPSWGATAQEVLGGPIFRNNTDGKALRFLPAESWNTAIVYDRVSVGVKTMQMSYGGTLDGGGIPTGNTNFTGGLLNQNAADALRRTTLSTGSGAAVQPINAVKASGSIAYLHGIECYDTATPDMAVINAGRAGLTTGVFGTDYLAPINTILSMAPSLTLVYCMGINDGANAGVTVDTYLSNTYGFLKPIADAGASIIIVTAPPVSPANGFNIRKQEAIRRGSIDMALRNDWVGIDLFELLVSQAFSSSYYYDVNHLKANGAAMVGNLIAQIAR